jgi:proteasome lid subunit RPN8/RPN11
MMRLQLPGASWKLEFADHVLELMSRHIQKSRFSRESVGQLYARDLTAPVVQVAHATKLQPSCAAWARVQFNMRQAGREREELFRTGWHCVGFWHTHPEPRPTPSAEDLAFAREHARGARPEVSGLVFAILGNHAVRDSLRVWFDDGYTLRQMAPVDPEANVNRRGFELPPGSWTNFKESP